MTWVVQFWFMGDYDDLEYKFDNYEQCKDWLNNQKVRISLNV
jgi:hypothetical protein